MSTSDSDSDDMTWIEWFCSLKGNEFLCEVDEAFIENDFNLYGLSSIVPHFTLALETILQLEYSQELSPEFQYMVDINASILYGLIHARYIVTPNGQLRMLEKYKNGDFGTCARIQCKGQFVLPIGLNDNPNIERVRLYCPCCHDIYAVPRRCDSRKLDGAFFGTTFPHLLLLQSGLEETTEQNVYTPKVFGFEVIKGPYQRPSEENKFEGRRKFCHY
ncbi:Casein kinase II subunit beta [Entamoeba marina]